jgi:K+-transporting ATPase KdpF subunit
MSVDDVIGLLVAGALFVYLGATLFFPERF